jgi:hypothetical protein
MKDFLVAEAAIRQLHARYIDAVWRKDIEAFAECFTQDAHWEIAGLQIRGRAAIGNQLSKLLAASERVLMFVGLPILDVSHATATGRIYITEYIKRLDGSALRTIGVYYDHYIDAGPRWLFQSRQLSLAYRGAPDLSMPFMDCPNYGPHPGMPGGDESTSMC